MKVFVFILLMITTSCYAQNVDLGFKGEGGFQDDFISKIRYPKALADSNNLHSTVFLLFSFDVSRKGEISNFILWNDLPESNLFKEELKRVLQSTTGS